MNQVIRVSELKGIDLPSAFNPHYLPEDAEKGYKFSVTSEDEFRSFAYMFSFPAYNTLIWSGKTTLRMLEKNFRKIVRELVAPYSKEEAKTIHTIFYIGEKEIRLPLIVKPYYEWEKKLNDVYSFFLEKRAHSVTDMQFRSGKDSWNYRLSYVQEGWHFTNNQITFSGRTLRCGTALNFLQKTSVMRLSDEELKEFTSILGSLSNR